MTDRSVGIHFSRRHPIILLIVVVISSAFLIPIIAQEQPPYPYDNTDRSLDTLAYVSEDHQLILYDPYNRTGTTLLQNVSNFILAQNGRVAFTRVDENDHVLYMFDPSTPAIDPINISQNPTSTHYPLAWSPDGQYLAFASFSNSADYSHYMWVSGGSYMASSNHQSLHVWDGEKVTNVMPENALDTADGFHVDWSYDGRLVFNISYGSSNLSVPPETYIWDGSSTINLSQNPQAGDSGGSWSRDGQLLFSSIRNNEHSIYVWDGTSFKNGVPNTDSFIRLAPELALEYATWMNDGSIALYTTPLPSATKEIVIWDVENESIIRQLPVVSDNQWSSLTEDGQIILSSHLASGIPSVYLDVENTSGNILLSIHTGEFSWSSGGYLAYCGIEERFSRILTIWDGQETWVVDRVSYRPIQWQNMGQIFSCNNG